LICRSIQEIADMVNGDSATAAINDIIIQGVSIDSRTIKSGNLFIPLIRIKNGHDYVQEAHAKGAVVSLWQKDQPSPPSDIPLIFVDDCLQALQELARLYRQQLPIKVIGITGSNGKTTTKDMINSVLETTHRVHKTKGNLNSQIGVPLTLLDISPSTEIAVIEMGMSERGQIGRLSQISQPDFVVITMIGLSHLSSLGSREEIALAKLEITEGLGKDGVLLFNGDEPLLLNKMGSLDKLIPAVRFGLSSTNDYYSEAIQVETDGITFICKTNQYRIPIIGKHNVTNALAAIAVADKLGLQPAAIRTGLENVIVTAMRMEKVKSSIGTTIINDAWNASPVSVKVAIDTLVELEGYSNKIVVLGDMLELGENELEYHREIGQYLKSDNIHYVFTLGGLASEIAREATKHFPNGRVKAYQNKEELIQGIQAVVRPADVILVKGSRGMTLEKVVEGLTS
jgi:UDP-N-acetylmuramoyl-tripeptide--D-alanyl-D-alanine ligase